MASAADLQAQLAAADAEVARLTASIKEGKAKLATIGSPPRQRQATLANPNADVLSPRAMNRSARRVLRHQLAEQNKTAVAETPLFRWPEDQPALWAHMRPKNAAAANAPSSDEPADELAPAAALPARPQTAPRCTIAAPRFRWPDSEQHPFAADSSERPDEQSSGDAEELAAQAEKAREEAQAKALKAAAEAAERVRQRSAARRLAAEDTAPSVFDESAAAERAAQAAAAARRASERVVATTRREVDLAASLKPSTADVELAKVEAAKAAVEGKRAAATRLRTRAADTRARVDEARRVATARRLALLKKEEEEAAAAEAVETASEAERLRARAHEKLRTERELGARRRRAFG